MSAPDEPAGEPVAVEDLLPFTDPAYWNDPYPYYDRVRELTPVYESPAGLYVLTRFDDVNSLIRSPHTSALHVDLGVGWRFHDSVLGQDMPDHLRLRKVFSKWFGGEPVKRWAARTQASLDASLARIEADGGSCDLVDDVMFPATFDTITTMFGVPAERPQECRDHVYFIGRALAPGATDDEMARGEASFEWYQAHIDAQIAAKRAAGLGEDLLSTFITAQDDGAMTRAEVVATMTLLYAVGFLDNTHLMANGILQCLLDPVLRQRYVDDPAVRPNAVLEILRHETSEQFVVRAIKDGPVEVSGVMIPDGAVVMMLLGAANRDPRMFPQPDRLDVDRDNLHRHLGFGGGIHACIGFALAKAQGEAAMTSLLTRYPDLTLDGDVTFGHTEFLRVITHLPVRLGTRTG